MLSDWKECAWCKANTPCSRWICMGKLLELWECADSSVSISIEIRSAEFEYDVYLMYTVFCMPSNFISYYYYIVKVSNARFTFVFRLVVFVTIEFSDIRSFQTFQFCYAIPQTPGTWHTRAKFSFHSPLLIPKQIKMWNKRNSEIFRTGVLLIRYTLLSKNLMWCELVEQLHQHFLDFPQIQRRGNIGFLANNSHDQI